MALVEPAHAMQPLNTINLNKATDTLSPLTVVPDPGGSYTSLPLPGSWSGYDGNQTLSVQMTATGTFAWGDVIQQTVRSLIVGPVNATGATYRNNAKECSYSKIGVAANYSFHASCPGFARGDNIIFSLNYSFDCLRVGNPCSIAVLKSFIVT
jgi:hypothetical protein